MKIKEIDTVGYEEWWCEWWVCNECKHETIARSFKYCPNCGEKIEWVKAPPKIYDDEKETKT